MKILVILSRIPYPLDKGDKLRAFNQIKHLSKKHEIILCTLNDTLVHKDAITTLEQYCSHLKIIHLSKLSILLNIFKSLLNGNPLQIGYFYSNKAQKQVDSLVAKHNPDHIYCQLVRTTEYVKKYTHIPKTLDYMDAFSKGIERRIPTAPIYLKPILMLESKRLAKYENEIFNFFNTKTIISKQDRDLIRHPNNKEIKVIANGVDTDYLKPLAKEKQYDLLFTGNMGYPPNIDSVVYLVKEVLPIVLKTHPGTKLMIAGTNPSKGVLALKSDNISVSGWVKDMREYYARSKIFIAPMQIGIGMQNKLLEAMAMQLPCITSSLANNAIGAKDGEFVLIGEEPKEYARHIIDLLENDNKAKELAINGYNLVRSTYNWDTITSDLEKLIC